MQAGIDIMGVVTSVGPLGSVKRKSDNSELSRRDITLLDQRYAVHISSLYLIALTILRYSDTHDHSCWLAKACNPSLSLPWHGSHLSTQTLPLTCCARMLIVFCCYDRLYFVARLVTV